MHLKTKECRKIKKTSFIRQYSLRSLWTSFQVDELMHSLNAKWPHASQRTKVRSASSPYIVPDSPSNTQVTWQVVRWWSTIGHRLVTGVYWSLQVLSILLLSSVIHCGKMRPWDECQVSYISVSVVIGKAWAQRCNCGLAWSEKLGCCWCWINRSGHSSCQEYLYVWWACA